MKISRRKFLLGVSLSALTAGPAGAGLGLHGSSALVAPTGNALINDGSSSQSFIWANIHKCAHSFGPHTNATYAWQATLDSNGYPNNGSLSDDIQYLFAIPPRWGTTPLVVSWKGTGAFYMQPAAVSNFVIDPSSGAHVDTSILPTFIKVTGTNVRITFNFTTAPLAGEDGYIGYFFGGGTYSGFNSLIFCRQSDETAVNADQNALNPDYVAMLKTLNPRTFRGLDISGVNNGNQSRFSQRAPAGAFSFFAERYPPECWSGSASGNGSSGSPYIISTPSGWAGLVDGATVQVQFTNANTTFQPVANVGSTGNIRITNLAPADLNVGDISAGDVWTLTYSSIYNYWTGHTVNSPNPSTNANQGGIQVRAPLEQHIAIANAANCNCWYNICHRMSPADGTALTAVVLANLNSNLAFYPELSNEVWNSANQQTSFIGNAGLTMGLGPGNTTGLMSGYGLLMRRMMGAITTAWGGPNSRLRRVMGFQAYGDAGSTGENNLQRFKGNNLAPNGTGTGGLGLGNSVYNAFTTSADYTASPNRPIDFSDVMSYATYYAGGQLQQFDANYFETVNAQTGGSGALKSITGISKANPGILTFASDPGYATGYRVNISGVVGMTQINGANVSLIRVTPTTYSMFTDATLGTGYDTSGYTAWSSGGVSAIYPIISGLTAWADLYGSNPTSALNSLDTDLRSGSQYNGSGVLSQNGTQTLLDLSTNIYPAWEAIAASYDGAGRPSGTTNLTIENYEGGMGGLVPSAGSCTILGINTSYVTSIQTLVTAYKNNALFSTLVQNQYAQFLGSGSLPHSKTPGWYQIVGFNVWSLTSGDLYTVPPAGSGQYQSWNGNVTFN